MTNPLITVIIPVYNVEGYISETLDSILDQTYTHWECICVNDGSKDGSARILETYAARDSRIRVIHQENAGVSAARNKGLALMKGDYFTFCDGDDLYKPGLLEFYREQVQAYDVDVVEVSVELFSGDGSIHWTAHEVEINTLPDMLVSQGAPLPPISTILPCVWNKLVKRSIWENNKVYFSRGLSIGEDRLFFALLYQSCASYLMSSVRFVRYRKDRPDSVMTASSYKRIIRDDIRTFTALFISWAKLGRWKEVRLDVMELYFNMMRHRLSQLKGWEVIAVWPRVVYLFHRMFLTEREQGEKMLYLRYASFYKKVLLRAFSSQK